MRKIVFLAWAIMLGGAMAVAQTSSTGSTSSQGKSTGTSASQTTLRGCLTGSSGNFTLTDQSGATFALSGSTDKLQSHVGQQVEVTGQNMASSSGYGSPSSSRGDSSGYSPSGMPPSGNSPTGSNPSSSPSKQLSEFGTKPKHFQPGIFSGQ